MATNPGDLAQRYEGVPSWIAAPCMAMEVARASTDPAERASVWIVFTRPHDEYDAWWPSMVCSTREKAEACRADYLARKYADAKCITVQEFPIDEDP